MKSEKHPTLTPLRALELLRDVDKRGAVLRQKGDGHAAYGYEQCGDALANHIRAALSKRRRRRARRG